MAEGASITPPLPRSDRITILVGLGGVTALSWVYLVVMALGMDDMPRGGYAHGRDGEDPRLDAHGLDF